MLTAISRCHQPLAKLASKIPAFLARHGSSDAAQAVVAAEAQEIDLYERHRAFVSYGFYLAQKVDAAS